MSTIYLSEKKEYRALDFLKFVAAFLVVAIHIPPFEEIAPVFSHEFQQVICRMAVPFFFVCTGYFIGEKITDKDRVKKYLFHIIKMYVWWSLLYLIPIIDRFWEKKRSAAGNLSELARRFFLIGSYIQLWYLLATVVAVLLLYLLVTRFRWNVKGIISVAVLLYLIGVCHNTYRHVFDNVLPAASEIKWYLSVFATARNGIFFGFPFVTMGYLFWAKSDHIRKMTYGWHTVYFLVLMMLEEWIVTQKIGESSHDMYLLTPLVTANLFLAAAFLPVGERMGRTAKVMRALSTEIFLLHMLVYFWYKKILGAMEFDMGNHLVRYLVVVSVSVLIGLMLIYRKKRTKTEKK